jgi:hypothetical protein
MSISNGATYSTISQLWLHALFLRFFYILIYYLRYQKFLAQQGMCLLEIIF